MDYNDINPTMPEETRTSYRWLWLSLIAALFAIYMLFSLANTAQDFLFHHHGWAGARRSHNAQNYLRYGYIDSKLGTMDNLGEHYGKDGKADRFNYYWHHPPMTNLALSVVFKVFGEAPSRARFTMAVFSWAALLFLFFGFRNLWGYDKIFFSLLYLTFIPIYSTYLNFVNYEMGIFASMAGMIFFYERYLRSPRPVYAAMIFLFMFTGCFSDYPMFPFLFFFWLFTGIARLSHDRKRWGFHLVFVLAVFVTLGLVIWHLKGMQDSWNSFINLFMGRHKMGGGGLVPYKKLMERWNYYYAFFTPMAYLLSSYYLVDLLARLWKRRVDRTDGYILSFLGTGLCYAIPLKSAAYIHEYTAWYMAPFFAFASGVGLVRLGKLVARFSRPVSIGVLVVFGLSAVVYGGPKFFVKRAHPIYEYSKSIESMQSGTKFDYELDYDLAGLLVQQNSEPDEYVLVTAGGLRMEFNYYIDRRFKPIKQEQFKSMVRTGKYGRYLVHSHHMNENMLAYLCKKYSFISYRRFYIFDLRGDWDHSTVKRKVVHPSSDFARYFTSMVHGPYELVDDPDESLDCSLKWGKEDSVKYWQERIDPARKDLPAAVARYNVALSLGKNVDLNDVTSLLTSPRKESRVGPIQWHGFRVDDLADGRKELTLVMSAERPISTGYWVFLYGLPRQEDHDLRKELGDTTMRILPRIPAFEWVPGRLYIVRTVLAFHRGEWDLSFGLRIKDRLTPLDLKETNPQYPLSCHRLSSEENERLDEAKAQLALWREQGVEKAELYKQLKKNFPELGLRVKKLGQNQELWGCMASPVPGGFRLSLLVDDIDLAGRPLMYRLTGKAKKRKKHRSGEFKQDLGGGKVSQNAKPGDVYWVEGKVSIDPSDYHLKLTVEGDEVLYPLTPKKNKRLFIAYDELGIRFPFDWIHAWDINFE